MISKIDKKSALSSLGNHSISPFIQPDLNNMDLSLLNIDKKWVQIDLRKFDSNLNLSYGKEEVIMLGKEVDYQTIVFFIQCFQDLVTFKHVNIIKTNLIILLHEAIFE